MDMVMESPIYQEWPKDERTEKALEIARATLKEGIPEEKVIKITGLDQETVLKLKAELN
jgi:uncharacterized protein YdaT